MITTWLCDKEMRDEHRTHLKDIIGDNDDEDFANIARDGLTVLNEFERIEGLVRALYSVLSQTDVKDRKALEIAINSHFGITP